MSFAESSVMSPPLGVSIMAPLPLLKIEAYCVPPSLNRTCPPSSASSQPTPQTTINVTDFVGIDADNVVALTTARQDVPEQSTSVSPQRIDSPQTQQVSQEKETVGTSENIGQGMHASFASPKHISADLRTGSQQEKEPDSNASVTTPNRML